MPGSKKTIGIFRTTLVSTSLLFALATQAQAGEIVNFDVDQFGAAVPDGAILSAQYRNYGVVFTGQIYANTEDAYISPFNTATYRNPSAPNLPVTAYAWFTVPGTDTAATTDSVSLTPTDSSTLSIFILTAYGADGNVLATAQTIVEPSDRYLPSEDEVVTIAVPGIRYISFSGSLLTQGEFAIGFDNMTFSTPSAVPEPSTVSLLVLGAIALLSRKLKTIGPVLFSTAVG